MLVINSIEKTRLSADSYSYSGTGVAWKARLVLFLGFALMAGGLAGSVVSIGLYIGFCVLSTNYISHTGCSCVKIYPTGISISNFVFWNSKCHCERTDNAEVPLPLTEPIVRIC